MSLVDGLGICYPCQQHELSCREAQPVLNAGFLSPSSLMAVREVVAEHEGEAETRPTLGEQNRSVLSGPENHQDQDGESGCTVDKKGPMALFAALSGQEKEKCQQRLCGPCW